MFGGGREQHGVEGFEQDGGGRAGAGEGVEVVGEGRAGGGRGGVDDRGNRGIGSRRAGSEKFAHGRIAFGDDGTVVEQARGLEQGREIDRLDLESGFEGRVDGLVEGDAVVGAQCVQLRGIGDGQAGDAGCGEADVGGPGSAAGVALVGARHGGGRGGGEVEGGGEDGERVVVRAGRDDTVGGDDAEGRLDADQAVEGGGDAAGTRCVGAESDIGDTQGDRDRRAGTGAAGYQIGVVCVADRAVGTAGADQAGRELIEVGLAEHDRASGGEPLDGGGGFGWDIREFGAARGGRQARDIDIVLHRDQKSRQRQHFTGREPPFDRRRVGHNLGLIAQGDPDFRAIDLGDTRVGGRDAVRRPRTVLEPGGIHSVDSDHG